MRQLVVVAAKSRSYHHARRVAEGRNAEQSKFYMLEERSCWGRKESARACPVWLRSSEESQLTRDPTSISDRPRYTRGLPALEKLDLHTSKLN